MHNVPKVQRWLYWDDLKHFIIAAIRPFPGAMTTCAVGLVCWWIQTGEVLVRTAVQVAAVQHLGPAELKGVIACLS